MEQEKAPKLKRIWDNFIEVGEVRKSGSIKFVVAAAIRDGVKYINIREFYLRKKDNVWRPGRDGITIPIVVPINEGKERLNTYATMSDAIQKAAQVLSTMPLADKEHEVYMVMKERKKKEDTK